MYHWKEINADAIGDGDQVRCVVKTGPELSCVIMPNSNSRDSRIYQTESEVISV